MIVRFMAARLELTDRAFGSLVVLSRAPGRQGLTQKKTQWLCRCECGNVVKVDTADLVRTDAKRRVSCGCMNHRVGMDSHGWTSPNAISSTYWTALTTAAARRGLRFTLRIEGAYELFRRQEGRCELSGMKIVLNDTASLDRIDSAKGYTDGNVQWLHKDINRLKSDWPEDRFIEMCGMVTKYVGT